jgi:hypothetical protein
MGRIMSWNATKKELWKSDVKTLMAKLQELETEKMKMEIYLRQDGHQCNRIAYPPSRNKELFKAAICDKYGGR